MGDRGVSGRVDAMRDVVRITHFIGERKDTVGHDELV